MASDVVFSRAAKLFAAFSLAGFLVLSSAEPAFAQRARRPSNDLSSGLGALGVLPDSVRSILLIHGGKTIPRATADKIEAGIVKNERKIDDRLSLIGYYVWNSRGQADHLRLRNHVLWVVENHPEHPATSEPSLRDLPDDPEGNTQIHALWRKHLETRSEEVAVLKNAEKFFFGKDPAEADRIIHILAAREPDNRQWPAELADLYRIFGIPGLYFSDPAERAAEAYKRVLALTRSRTARETLAGEMAAAAFKIGDFGGAAHFAGIQLKGTDRGAVQTANTILGRVALRTGNLAAGKEYLLASSNPEAGHEVAVAGPTMVLAKELLEKGEREVVIQYLQNCIPLWPRGETFLRNWIADIERGRTPNFGNLAF